MSAADTICSCTEASDELLLHTLGHEYMERDVNTFPICVYVSIAYSASKKADFHYFPADTICSCIEAVNELFQDTMGYDCMGHDVDTIAVCVYMTIVYSTFKKRFSLFQLQIP